jgi:hypothetical protein
MQEPPPISHRCEEATPYWAQTRMPPVSDAPSPTARQHPGSGSRPPGTSPPCSASTPTPCSARCVSCATRGCWIPARPRRLGRRHPRTRSSHQQSPRARRVRPPPRLHRRRADTHHQERPERVIRLTHLPQYWARPTHYCKRPRQLDVPLRCFSVGPRPNRGPNRNCFGRRRDRRRACRVPGLPPTPCTRTRP